MTFKTRISYGAIMALHSEAEWCRGKGEFGRDEDSGSKICGRLSDYLVPSLCGKPSIFSKLCGSFQFVCVAVATNVIL